MIFKDPSGVLSNAPPPLIVVYETGFFSLVLDTSWLFPTFAQWIVDTSTSSDGITYGAWEYVVGIASASNAYNYINIDITKYYQFRYRVQSRIESSLYSNTTVAGKPKVLIPSGGGYIIGTY